MWFIKIQRYMYLMSAEIIGDDLFGVLNLRIKKNRQN